MGLSYSRNKYFPYFRTTLYIANIENDIANIRYNYLLSCREGVLHNQEKVGKYHYRHVGLFAKRLNLQDSYCCKYRDVCGIDNNDLWSDTPNATTNDLYTADT